MATPLARQLFQTIKLSGPITVAQYMRQALLHPQHGYYNRKKVFGIQGDFITSPDISQLFGEMLGIWVLAEWKAAGSPKPVRITEYGPGRATLLRDLLTVLQQFPQFELGAIDLVEASDTLKEVQGEMLQQCLPPSQLEQTCISWFKSHRDKREYQERGQAWEFHIMHEFLDALPCHQFMRNDQRNWREVLIDWDYKENKLIKVLAQGITPSSFLVNLHNPALLDHLNILERSPEAYDSVSQVAQDISSNPLGGCALVIDYGFDKPQNRDTLRVIPPLYTLLKSGKKIKAFKAHQRVEDVLSMPGECDLSVDVDFGYVSSGVPSAVQVLGPVSQREFLLDLGIEARLGILLKATHSSRHATLISGFQRITGEMGQIYKVMALKSGKSSSITYGFSTSKR